MRKVDLSGIEPESLPYRGSVLTTTPQSQGRGVLSTQTLSHYFLHSCQLSGGVSASLDTFFATQLMK